MYSPPIAWQGHWSTRDVGVEPSGLAGKRGKSLSVEDECRCRLSSRQGQRTLHTLDLPPSLRARLL
jgi:hypothetical protein